MEDPANDLLVLQSLSNDISNGASTITPRKYASISNKKRALIIHSIDTLGMSVIQASKHYQVARSTISSIKRIFYSEARTTKKPSREITGRCYLKSRNQSF